ncbi:hypothetical protein Tco_0757954 [Tanacetum coccineum]
MDTKSSIYSFQLDEQWFTLDADLLRSALGITPKDLAHPFVAPPAGDVVIDFMNNLGYPEELQFVSKKYYQRYLEMAARKPRQPSAVTDEESVKKKTVSPADKSKKPTPTKQTKPMKEKSTKPTPLKKVSKVDDDEYNLQRGIQISLESFQAPLAISVEAEKEKYYGSIHFLRQTPVTKEASTRPYIVPQDDTSVNVVCDTPSPADAETGADTEKSNSGVDTEILYVVEEQGEDVSHTVALEVRTVELDEGQVRSDPGNTLESRPLPDEDQAGSNP